MSNKGFVSVKDMDLYKLSRQLSKEGWDIYKNMNYEEKKIMGDQFIRAIDSVGANFTEGIGRFYHLDKIRFYYNSRASMLEAIDYWLELLQEREKITKGQADPIRQIAQTLQVKLNNLISSTYQQHQKKGQK